MARIVSFNSRSYESDALTRMCARRGSGTWDRGLLPRLAITPTTRSARVEIAGHGTRCYGTSVNHLERGTYGDLAPDLLHTFS